MYDRVLHSLKKLDTSYNLTVKKIHYSVIEVNYKITEDTRVIPIVEHKDEEMQWVCSTSIYLDFGEPETLKEAIRRPNGHVRKISAISEVNNFLSRKT